MVCIDSVKKGIERFIDCELAPHLPIEKQLGVKIYMGLALSNTDELIKILQNKFAFAITGLIGENGQIDIDKLYNTTRPLFEEKRSFDIPFIGTLAFTAEDVDKLYRYILEG